jgi:hypothetical protein
MDTSTHHTAARLEARRVCAPSRALSLSLLAGYPSKRVCVKLCHRAPPHGGVARRQAQRQKWLGLLP